MELGHLPQKPGVYLMRDNTGKILYIGKAINLKKRVTSYFLKRNDFSLKLASLLSVVKHIDYIPTASERDCLILEQRLIRKLQPVYNTVWRDDKSFPFIKLTNEDYPRIFLTRQKKPDGGQYFGPYPHVKTVKRLLRTLWRNNVFRLRPCKFDFSEKDIVAEGGLQKTKPSLYKKVQSCIYLHTGECLAPCVGKASKEEYAKTVKQMELFLKGKYIGLEQDLEREMKEAVKNLNYERAAELRDQLQALSQLAQPVTFKQVDEATVTEHTQVSRGITELQEALGLKTPPVRIECFDISNFQGTEPVASMVVFERGAPHKSDYRKFKIKTVTGPNDFAMMEEVVRRRYLRVIGEDQKLPDLILVDGGKGQLSSAVKAIQDLKAKGIKKPFPELALAGLAKENEEVFLPGRSEPIVLPKDSQALHILQYIRDEAHRFAITFHRQRRDKLLLPKNK